MKRAYVVLVCVLLTTLLSHAQSVAPSAASDTGQAKPPAQQPSSASHTQNPPVAQSPDQGRSKTDRSATNAKGTSNDRLFFALPNFLTVENASRFPPLTAQQKFGVVARSSFDPVEFAWYGALAGISQAENSEAGYGQGAEGYGKRYGAYFADGTVENFFVGAIFPAMLHQDPRYFQNGQGTFWHRTGYSVSRIFVTRTDSADRQFNYSEIMGSAIASAISTYSYHPHPGYHPQPGVNVRYVASDRTVRNTLSVWGSQVGYDTITLVVKEFWPDIRRKIKKQHRVVGE